MTSKREAFLQELGRFAIQCSETKIIAPSTKLMNLFNELFPEAELDDSFTQSFDAQVWAKAFVDRFQPIVSTDDLEGLMIGWFANALMRGYDEHAQKHQIACLDREVLQEVWDERDRQDAKWGGPEHDDTNTQMNWNWYRRERENGILNNQVACDPRDRRYLVEIAALAVAQIESFDREFDRKAGM